MFSRCTHNEQRQTMFGGQFFQRLVLRVMWCCHPQSSKSFGKQPNHCYADGRIRVKSVLLSRGMQICVSGRAETRWGFQQTVAYTRARARANDRGAAKSTICRESEQRNENGDADCA